MAIKIVAIGASAGGVAALQKFFQALPKKFQAAIAVVLHLPADTELSPKLIFGHHTSLPISEVIDKLPINPGEIYFAPPDYHLLLETSLTFSLSQDDLVNFSRPSIDVLFESAAQLRSQACGILMTGANHDGASGLKAIQSCHGYTMVQDPKEAEVSYMPQSALEIMKPDFVGSIKEIAEKLGKIIAQESHGKN